MAPILKTYLENQEMFRIERPANRMLPASILASALFIGSAIMIPYNPILPYFGFAAAAATILAGYLKK
jgi:hypothetical protein